jgi:hypothetical protein
VKAEAIAMLTALVPLSLPLMLPVQVTLVLDVQLAPLVYTLCVRALASVTVPERFVQVALIPEVWDAPDSIMRILSPAAAPALATPARVFLRKANVRPLFESLPPISSTNQVLVMSVPRWGVKKQKSTMGTV